MNELTLRKLRLPTMSKGQKYVTRAQLATGDVNASAEDVMDRLNRHERRTVQAEARQYKREQVKREARKNKRAAETVTWTK